MHSSFQSKQGAVTDQRVRGHRGCQPRWLIIGLLLLLVSAASARQQQTKDKPEQKDQPVRLKANLVDIRAVVTDKQGKTITGLNKEDFEVLENGREQLVSFFSAESLKAERRVAEAAGNPPNRRLTTAAPPRRSIVLLVDTLHIAMVNLLRARQELLKFIDEGLGDEDLAAVVSTGGGLGVYSQFTQDKQVLRSAVNRLSILTVPRPDSLVVMEAMDAQEALDQTRLTLLTVKAVTTHLGEMPGQRLILMLSDGFPLVDRAGMMDSDDLQAAISRASRSGVVIYTMLAKGFTGPSLYDASRRRAPDDPRAVYDATRRRAPDNPGAAIINDRLLEHGLERLAKGTGGEAYLTTNDLKGAMEKATDANSFYYALGYYPGSADAASGFRHIDVRVKGHADYIVRSQSGYFASEMAKKPSAPADPHQALLKALSAPLPLSGINLEAAAKFLPLPMDNAQVSLEVFIDNTRLTYTAQANSFLTSPTLLVGVLDKDSNTVDVLQDVIHIRLAREQLARARQSMYRYTRRLALKPGLYQIRVGVRDPQTELIGTAAAWVEVLELKSRKLTLSSLSTAKSHLAEAGFSNRLGVSLLPNVHNGINLFRSNDLITYSGYLYNTAANERSLADLMAQVEIRQGEQITQVDDWQPFKSLIFSEQINMIEFGGGIKTDKLKPGVYELRIRLKQAKSDIVLMQTTHFEIVP